MPFFVTRQVVCGAGRVGLGQDGRSPGFQISQRADFFEVEVGLETTLKRPIINTRDEPHADADRYRRLHVIIGDANLSEISTYLKVGTTVSGARHDRGRLPADDLAIAQPVRELHEVSHDPSLQHLIRLPTVAGDRARPAGRVLRPGAEVRRRPLGRGRRRADPGRSRTVGIGLSRLDGRPYHSRRAGLGGEAAAAERIPRSRRPRLGCAAAATHRPAVLRRTGRKGLYHRLVARGAMQTLLPTGRHRRDRLRRRRTPARTSAASVCAATAAVAAASWDSVIFDVGRESLVGCRPSNRYGAPARMLVRYLIAVRQPAR